MKQTCYDNKKSGQLKYENNLQMCNSSYQNVFFANVYVLLPISKARKQKRVYLHLTFESRKSFFTLLIRRIS